MNLKKHLPHGVAFLLFIAISLIYFYPVLEGYKLKQGDVKKHKAMAHEMRSHAEKYDELALWSGNMFAGMPTYLTGSVRYDGNIISFFNKLNKAFLPNPAGMLFAYLIGFYILLICMGISPWLSLVGAIAFAFSSYFLVIIEAGHTSKALAIAYMAPIFGGFIQILRGNKIGFLLILLYTAVQIYVNHLQITYYLLFVILFYWLAKLIESVKVKTLKPFFIRSSFALLAALLAVLPNLGGILTTYEYSKYSTRGGSEISVKPNGQVDNSKTESGLDKDYITQWSYGIDESFTLISPNVKGGASIPILADNEEVERLRKEDPAFFNTVVKEYQANQNAISAYFGDQPIVSGPVYIGIVVVFLALLAVFFIQNWLVYSLTAVTFLALLLSWGKNFMGFTEFFIDFIPGYNKFRAVSMILVIVEFTVPILAILFVDFLVKNTKAVLDQRKKLFSIAGGFALFLLFFSFSPSSFVNLLSEQEMAQFSVPGNGRALEAALIDYRAEIVSDSLIRSLQFFILGSAFIFLFVFSKIKKEVLFLGLGSVILIDLWVVDKEYINNKQNEGGGRNNKYISWEKPQKFYVPFQANAADEAIFQTELAAKPKIKTNLEERLDALRKEGEKVEPSKILDVKYSSLMEETHYRVLNLDARLDQDARAPYFHKTLGGYHGAKMKRYQDLIDFHLGQEHYQVASILQRGGKQALMNYLPKMQTVNMLNSKYILSAGQALAKESGVMLNPYAFGNAWLAEELIQKANPDSVILSLKNYDLSKQAIVDQKDIEGLDLSLNYQPQGSIELGSYRPNRLEYSFNFPTKQLVVFSEVYYDKGWTAYVNGEEMPYFRTNYLLRAMEVPAGKGKIEFVFEPEVVAVGRVATWASTTLILVLVAAFAYSGFKGVKES